MGDDESRGEGSVSMGRVRTKARMAAWSGHRQPRQNDVQSVHLRREADTGKATTRGSLG